MDEDEGECCTTTPPVHIVAYWSVFEPATHLLPVQLLNQWTKDPLITSYSILMPTALVLMRTLVL